MGKRAQTPNVESKTIIGRITNDRRKQNEHKSVVNYLKKLTASERLNLMVFIVMSSDTPVKSEASNQEVTDYIESLSLDELHRLHHKSLSYNQGHASMIAQFMKNSLATAKKPEPAPKPAPKPSTNFNPLTIRVPQGTEPVSVISISREESHPELLSVNVLNFESGDYVPVSPRVVAQLLHSTADTLVSKQNDIEKEASGH